jgi:serine/threonine protein kinase
VQSDIYALGLILYELCSGNRAFTAATLAELREQKAGHTPRSLSDIRSGVDPILERLVTRCIDRDPRARPSSLAQLAAALIDCGSELFRFPHFSRRHSAPAGHRLVAHCLREVRYGPSSYSAVTSRYDEVHQRPR